MSIWTTLTDAGIDITRTSQGEALGDNGPVYAVSDPEGSRVVFAEEFEDGASIGWTYTAYDEEGGVITTDGDPDLAAILPDIARWSA